DAGLTELSFTGNSRWFRPHASSSLVIIRGMAETAEHPTTPTRTADPPPPSPVAGAAPRRGGPKRVYRVLAWVGIVAGVVFVTAVVFCSGFFMGEHSGRGHGHFAGHQSRGVHFFHRAGPPPAAPGFGPGASMTPGSPSTPSSPTTAPSPAPSPRS